MFSAVSMFPVVIALHLIEAALLFFLFRKKNDASARLWICASILYCLALGILLSFNNTSPFTRYFLGNFFALYSSILFIYSLLQLFNISIKWKTFDATACLLGAFVMFLLVKLNLSTYVGVAAGVSYGLLNTYSYFRLKRANKENNLGFNLISYTFLAIAILWFIRIPLSLKYEFKFAVDAGLANYILLFVSFALLIARDIGYLILRLRLTFNERIAALNDYSESIKNQMLKSLNAISHARDNETGNHIIRTQCYVREIALKLMEDGHYADQLNKNKIDAMFMVAPLHDIGKVGIPDAILLKPDSLNAQEWSIMKTHALIGETILQAAVDGDKKHAQLLQTAIEIAGGHHEKWNGTGYPRGISGQQIPLSARIMALADVYDALVSARVYKTRWSHEQAIEDIKRNSGNSFDPLVVEAFLSIQDRVKAIAAEYLDSEQVEH